MKKLFILALLIIAGLGILYMLRNTPLTENNDAVDNGANFRPNPKNATFVFEGESITLSNGKSERVKFNLIEETALLDLISYGDLNSDNREDAAILLIRSGGISGVFVYAAAYVSGPVGYKGTNTVFLGDRISPQSVSASRGIITVNYLDRAVDEPFASEPTVSVSKQFVYRNGILEER